MPGLIVHEWAERSGGAEQVVDQFLAAFPEADLLVAWNDAPERFPSAQETWLARTPLRRHKALALPLMPATWRTVGVARQPDWILTSSHLFAHHVRPRGVDPDTPKFSYVHTPARYIWEPELDHRGGNPLVRAVGAAFKPIDRKRAMESTKIAANSEFTRRRIQRAWGVDADVIYPPVEVERIIAGGDWSKHLSGMDADTLISLPETFLLGASRFVPYKRLDLVIEAGEANGVPVVLAGRGPDRGRLEAKAATATVPVTFVDRPSDELLYAMYQRCLAYVFPAIEDFGIMPVEAMAAGAFVIVPEVGGAAESVQFAMAGATVGRFDEASWVSAVELASRSERIGAVQSFSVGTFRERLLAWARGG